MSYNIHILRIIVTKEERLEKMTKNFSLLPDGKQEYILGIMQALAFAHNMTDQPEIVPSEQQQNHIGEEKR